MVLEAHRGHLLNQTTVEVEQQVEVEVVPSHMRFRVVVVDDLVDGEPPAEALPVGHPPSAVPEIP